MRKNKSNKIYFDYAATTPVDPRVFSAMKPYFGEIFGNPGSLHSHGQIALAAVDAARETISKSLGVDFQNIIFTGSATEANNLALRGIVKRSTFNVERSTQPKVVISAIEHESILETAKDLEKGGVEVVILPVDRKGYVDLGKLEKSLDERTVLVSIIYANNETGVVQPISEISEIIADFRDQRSKFKVQSSKRETLDRSTLNLERSTAEAWPLFHTDAVQAFQYLNCKPDDLGVDLLTISAHKIYGPKGVGALVLGSAFNVQRRTFNVGALAPILTGGGQEHGMRSGTENVPLIVGFGRAIELTDQSREEEKKRMLKLKEYLWSKLEKICPDAKLNGAYDAKGLPNILNIYFPGKSGEDLVTRLDLSGISLSSGSACRARSPEPSHVLAAMGLAKERIKKSIRVSLGRYTDKLEVDALVLRIKVVVKRYKE